MIKTNIVTLKCILPLQTSKPGYGTEYGSAQSVEMDHYEDSLFIALRMNYCYINLSHRTSEAVSDYYRRTEVLSFRLGVLLVAFYG